jgi:hypothetical protein
MAAEQERDPANEQNFGLRLKCTTCKEEQTIDFGRWPVRIIGAIEAICMSCGRKVTYVGTFGQPLNETRFLAEVRAAQAAGTVPTEPPAECEKQEEDETDGKGEPEPHA